MTGSVMRNQGTIRRSASTLAVAAALVLVSSNRASAGEPGGLPAALSGTSITSMQQRSTTTLVISDAPWLNCNDAQVPCSRRSSSIAMETSPKFDLDINLPNRMELSGYLWTMQLEDAEIYLRQAIGGPVIRQYFGEDSFAELGGGLAQRYVSAEPDDPLTLMTLGDRLDARDDPTRIGGAVMGAMGTTLYLNDFMIVDAKFRSGVGVGDGGAGIYHGHLVFAVTWK
jgi:hypothetical protein